MQLSEFYRNISAWPKTKGELTNAAERVGRLLDVPFAAIYVSEDSEEKIGYRLLGALGGEKIDPTVFEGFLKRQIKYAETVSPLSASGGVLKQIQLAPENLPWTNLAQTSHLTIAGIPLGGTAAPSTNGSSRRKSDIGWVIVGSSKALGPKEELLLLASAQKLSELAKINQLELAIQLRSQFLSIASHELKTPLTSIYGILQLQDRMARMKKEETTPAQEERKQSFLKIVIRQVERLNELIDGLLDVSRIQNNRFMVEPTEADVAAILRDTINARLTVIANENGVKLHLDAPQSLSTWVDPVRMEEVITNLVMNAIRFSPEGGVVWIKLKDEDDCFRLTIRDQGPSVPVEDRERIFQPFERAARTSRLGGLGLGLYISRQIAQLHGGNVSLVESVPGKGNVFEARFPRRNVSVISA